MQSIAFLSLIFHICPPYRLQNSFRGSYSLAYDFNLKVSVTAPVDPDFRRHFLYRTHATGPKRRERPVKDFIVQS